MPCLSLRGYITTYLMHLQIGGYECGAVSHRDPVLPRTPTDDVRKPRLVPRIGSGESVEDCDKKDHNEERVAVLGFETHRPDFVARYLDRPQHRVALAWKESEPYKVAGVFNGCKDDFQLV